eukprot:9488797-Pyramimonas_sp.AAC.2
MNYFEEHFNIIVHLVKGGPSDAAGAPNAPLESALPADGTLFPPRPVVVIGHYLDLAVRSFEPSARLRYGRSSGLAQSNGPLVRGTRRTIQFLVSTCYWHHSYEKRFDPTPPVGIASIAVCASESVIPQLEPAPASSLSGGAVLRSDTAYCDKYPHVPVATVILQPWVLR